MTVITERAAMDPVKEIRRDVFIAKSPGVRECVGQKRMCANEMIMMMVVVYD